jgi:hypothetical protein
MQWLIALLIWLSSDQQVVDASAAKAAAAVDCAYASISRPMAEGNVSGGKPVVPTGKCPTPPR